MTEQQIYIKTGIGLENFGKSQGITNEYIDAFIRPFYSSLDLFYLEGKDSPGYKSLIPLPDGSILIGSGMKLDREPYSFIHNFIIPAADAKKVVRSSAMLLSSPDSGIINSTYLSSLQELPGAGNDSFLKKYFTSLKMAHAEYMALLAAVFSSVEQNRNVFIALPRKTTVNEICAIMFGLYESLPYYIRQKTGFCTLFGETEIRPEINIYFIPDDKVIPGRDNFYIESYNASKDYIFNFSNKTYAHIADLKEELSGEYFTFISEALSEGRNLSDFFDFASEAGENLSHERKISLRFYSDLAYIYNLKNNEETLPQKVGRVTIIFAELLRSGEKNRIFSSYSEFIKLYRRYIKQKNILIPPEILKRLVLSYDFCPGSLKDELYDLITLDIDICLKDSGNEILFMHIDAAKGSSELYNKIIEQKMAPSNRLIRRYFTYLIEQRKTVHSVMEFADSIFSEMHQIADNDLIRSMLCERAMELYNTSGDRFEAVKYLEEKCLNLEEKYPENADLFSAIYRYALENYMNSLDISELNTAKIEKFPLTDGETINEDCTVKHKTALAAKEILALTDDVAMSFIHYDAFGFENVKKNLTSSQSDGKKAENNLKALLLRCIKEKKDAPRRVIYIILYYIFGAKDSKIQVDFDGIFEYIDKEMNIPPFEFIEWYLSSNLFVTPMTKNGRIVRDALGTRADLVHLTAFYEAMRKYFLRHSELLTLDRNMKKLKKEMDTVCLVHPDYRELTNEFRRVLSGIVSENYSPLKRIINRMVSAKNFKFTVLIASVVAILIAGVTIGGFFSSGTGDNEVLATLNDVSGEKVFTERTGWASFRISQDGEYLPATYCIDGTEKAEILNFEKDKSITVEFGNKSGIVIDGISIAAVLSDENVGFDVYVLDENNKKLFVGVSDYDISTGSSIYNFAKPMCIKKVIITPRGEQISGTVTLKEINAYIVK